MMTKMLQKEPIKVKCPHCMQVIQDAWICEMNSVIGIRYAYICSNCEKLLGISSQKNKNPKLISPLDDNNSDNYVHI